MGFSFFSSWTKKAPELEFWSWFEKNQNMLFHFENDQDRIFDKLSSAISKVHADLTFEFGPIDNGSREFVISADGLKDAFPAVEKLFLSAPELPLWKFIKFRPRRDVMTIQMGDVKLDPSDLLVTVEPDGGKAGLTVFVKNYDEALKNKLLHVVFIMLDQAIGEYDMETKVGFVESKPFEEQTQYMKHDFMSFAQIFDEFAKG
jgi:hypothetical protein